MTATNVGRAAAAAAGLLAVLLLADVAAAAASARAARGPLSDSEAVVEAAARDARQTVCDGAADAARIIDYVLRGAGRHQAYRELAEFVDLTGPRLSGSPGHALGVRWLLQRLGDEGLDNVHGEDVMVPHWERGAESLAMLEPRRQAMAVLGLGTSVGCANLTAEAVLVSSFDDLERKAAANLTQGRIVVFNQYCNWTAEPVGCYGRSVVYRVDGAARAARAGAVASLVRTVASYSLYTPHTGEQAYQNGTARIPAACLTTEDTDTLQRMADRGERIVLSLSMGARNFPPHPSQNVVAEIRGSVYPDEVVLVSGHLDSWDVGVGAMDDGGGAFISWMVLSVLRALGLRPKRTIRFVGWSCEEFGGVGSLQYWQRHRANASRHSLVMESDIGTFQARGLGFTGSPAARAALEAIAPLLAPINATQVQPGGDDTDTGWWIQDNVPGASLRNANDLYFTRHHSMADQMAHQDPDQMDSCLITFAVHSYMVANLDGLLPRANHTAGAPAPLRPPPGGRRHPFH